MRLIATRKDAENLALLTTQGVLLKKLPAVFFMAISLQLSARDIHHSWNNNTGHAIVNDLNTGNHGPLTVAVDVSGKVTDESGNPLQGATISVKGTSVRTSTNQQGVFSLKGVSGSAVLQVTFVGYATQEISLENQSTITIVMKVADVNMETVVVSYGLQKRKEVVGAVTQLKAGEIKDMPTGTFAEKLQGKFTGVQAAQVTGRPGQGMDFRIRGAASISASNSPLVVIDGFPVLGNADAINNINPDEIESFSVLKDAAATSLYGSRAANGVIIITTKRGKSGPPKVDFSTYYGVATLMKELKPEVMNATELATYMKGFYEDRIRYEGYTGGIPAEYQNPEQYGEGTDWYSLLMRNASVQNYSLSVSSGNDRSSLSMTGGYFNQDGIVKNTGYKRYSLRLNGDFTVNKNIKLGVNLAPSLQIEHNNRQGSNFNIDGQRAIVASTLMMPPMYSPYEADGSLSLGYSGGYSNLFKWANPLRQLLEISDDTRRSRLLSSVFSEISFLKNFQFRTSLNGDINGLSRKKFVPSTSRGGFNVVPIDNAPPGNKSAYGEASTNNNWSWLNENLLTYQTRIKNDHSIRALAGFSAQRWEDYRTSMTGEDFPDNKIEYLNAAARYSGVSSGAQAWSLLSLFSSVNYSYKGKYYVQGSIRRDGSSRFGADNKWGTFPSVGAGWVVSDEKFMDALSSKINYLKLRASYGLTGNNEIGNYTSLAGMGISNYVFGNGTSGSLASGMAQNGLGNALLSWEKNKQFDIGADIGLFNDRVTVSYDYYHKITDGLLYQVAVPRATGFGSIWSNVGTIKFWGHEVGVVSRNTTGALKWTTNFNISFDRNLVTKLGTNNAPIGGTTDFSDYRTEVGQPLGQFYGYVFDGVYMNQKEFDDGPKNAKSQVGTVRMKDLNGDGIIDAAHDRTFIGNPNPDFLFGLTNILRYKSFDLNIAASGTYGNEMKNSMTESLYNMDGVFNGPKELLHRWRSEEDPGNGRIQRTLSGSTVLSRSDNSMFIFDASHLTINNITLGYTLGNLKKISFVKGLRLYAGVQNAYIFTSYDGNPETSQSGLNGLTQGEDFGGYPVPRTFTLGLNMGL